MSDTWKPCGRGICAANEGHEGSCAEASGWNYSYTDSLSSLGWTDDVQYFLDPTEETDD